MRNLTNTSQQRLARRLSDLAGMAVAGCLVLLAMAVQAQDSWTRITAAAKPEQKYTGYSAPTRIAAQTLETPKSPEASSPPKVVETKTKPAKDKRKGKAAQKGLKKSKLAQKKAVASKVAKSVKNAKTTRAKVVRAKAAKPKGSVRSNKRSLAKKPAAALARTTNSTSARTTPPRALKMDAGAIGPSAGSAGSRTLAVEPKAFSPWIGAVPLALMLGGVYVWARRRETTEEAMPPVLQDPVFNLDPGDVATSSAIIKADLLRSAEPFFRNLRLASSRKDHDFFYQHCTEDLATSMILDSETSSEPGSAQVESLKAELVDLFEEVNRYVASVQYTADVQLGNTQPRKVRELWHFVREPEAQSWRLAAVEVP